jgi:hypothetical protein
MILKNNIWFSINLNDLEKFTGKKFNEFCIYLEDQEMKVHYLKK